MLKKQKLPYFNLIKKLSAPYLLKPNYFSRHGTRKFTSIGYGIENVTKNNWQIIHFLIQTLDWWLTVGVNLGFPESDIFRLARSTVIITVSFNVL